MAKYTVVIQDEEGDDLLRVEDVDEEHDADHMDIMARAVLEDRAAGASPIMYTGFIYGVVEDLRRLAQDLEEEANNIEEGPF